MIFRKAPPAFTISAIFFCIFACSSETSTAERLVIGKKYVLKSWPDSHYVARLDSVLKAEPLQENRDSDRTALTIYSGEMPKISLPGKPESVKPAESRKHAKTSGQAAKSSQAETFANRFMEALSALQSDPSNPARFTTVDAKDGESIFALLSRAYGLDASKLPRFYTISALQSVNPGTKIEHLSAGDKVRIPRF